MKLIFYQYLHEGEPQVEYFVDEDPEYHKPGERHEFTIPDSFIDGRVKKRMKDRQKLEEAIFQTTSDSDLLQMTIDLVSTGWSDMLQPVKDDAERYIRDEISDEIVDEYHSAMQKEPMKEAV